MDEESPTAKVINQLVMLPTPSVAQSISNANGSRTARPGSGTTTDPYHSINFAIQSPTTVAGDIVLVAPGAQREDVGITKRITLRSAAGPLLTSIEPVTDVNSVRIFQRDSLDLSSHRAQSNGETRS